MDKFAAAVGDAVKLVFTFWTNIDAPALDAASGPVQFIRDSTSWYVSALAVAAVLVGAARIAITQRAQEAGELTKALVRLLVTTTFGVPAIQLLLVAGDAYSEWIVDRASGGDLGARIVSFGAVGNLTGVSNALIFLVALLALFASIAQLAMMFVRAGVLILLVGLWPLSAALSNTTAGREWWMKTNGWLLAFVLYKPAAATVYAVAFKMVGAGTDSTTVLGGVFMLVLAALTLPALMRLAVPAVSAASAGGSGGGAGAAVGAVATGALMTSQLQGTASGSGQAGAGPGGPAGPSGARGPGGSAGSGAGPGGAAPAGGGSAASGGASAAGAGSSAAASAGTAAAAGPAAPLVVGAQVAAGAAKAASGAARGAADGASGESR